MPVTAPGCRILAVFAAVQGGLPGVEDDVIFRAAADTPRRGEIGPLDAYGAGGAGPAAVIDGHLDGRFGEPEDLLGGPRPHERRQLGKAGAGAGDLEPPVAAF